MPSTTEILSKPLIPKSEEDPESPADYADIGVTTHSTEHGSDSSPSISSPDSTYERRSRNIKLVLAYQFFAMAARSLWNQSVLSAYVFLLKTDDPKFVGFLTGVMGLSQMLTSFPAGFLADRYRRDTMLKVASIVGTVAVSLTYYAAQQNSFTTLASGLCTWGFFWGISNTSVMALFADSISDGDRSYYFMMRMLLQYFGNTFGPGTALILFSRLGNDWTLEECSVVMRAGQVVAIPALILLWFMNDDFCESDDNEETENSTYQLLSDDSDAEENMRNDEVDEEENDNEALLDTNDEEEHSALCCIPMHRVVPVMVASADIMAGLAAGMSIRYFPIFFLDNLKLSPAQVQVVFMCSMLSMAIMGCLAQWIGKKIGHLQVTICCKWTGAFLLMAMVAAYKNGANALCVCVLFILRTCIMNSPGALTRSVLMDHVPKEERAKWSALESVNMFSWSGSAALGGFLVDSEGILFNFTFTSVLQLFATIPLILVFKRVKSEN